MQTTERDVESPRADLTKSVILGSLAVVGVSLVLAILYPRARTAIATAIVVSPIPPVP